jgi:hypothetical protein
LALSAGGTASRAPLVAGADQHLDTPVALSALLGGFIALEPLLHILLHC